MTYYDAPNQQAVRQPHASDPTPEPEPEPAPEPAPEPDEPEAKTRKR